MHTCMVANVCPSIFDGRQYPDGVEILGPVILFNLSIGQRMEHSSSELLYFQVSANGRKELTYELMTIV